MRILLSVLSALVGLVLLYVLVLFISPLFIDPKKQYTKNSKYFRFLLNSSTGSVLWLIRTKVKKENFDKIPEGRFLMVCNHRSKFDPIVSWWILRKYDIAFISKPENFKVPAYGRIIRKCCFLPIDREDPRNALTTIKDAAALISSDTVSVGVYPEGTRNYGDELLPFHNGVFKIAQKAGVPLVVMGMYNADQIAKNFPLRGTTVTMRVLDVMTPDDYKTLGNAGVAEKAREEIAAFYKSMCEKG